MTKTEHNGCDVAKWTKWGWNVLNWISMLQMWPGSVCVCVLYFVDNWWNWRCFVCFTALHLEHSLHLPKAYWIASWMIDFALLSPLSFSLFIDEIHKQQHNKKWIKHSNEKQKLNTKWRVEYFQTDFSCKNSLTIYKMKR